MARNFDTSNEDHIEIGDVAALNITGEKITLSIWFKITTNAMEHKLLAKWSDSPAKFSYLLSIRSDNKPQIAINTGSTSTAIGTTPIVLGRWYYLVGTYDGTTMRIYLDGVEENTTAKTGNISSNTAPVRIGVGSGNTNEQPMDGDAGHCAIWDIDLTAGEVASLAVGISPLRIRRGDLVFYAPINGQVPELDIIGGLDLTVNGTTKSEEPPIPNSVIAA